MSDEAVFNKRMAKRQKKIKELSVEVKTEADKEIDAAVQKSKLQEEKDAQRKKIMWRFVYACATLLLIYGIYYLFKPYQARVAYGICKVYVELSVRYPDTLYFSAVDDFPTSVRLWYTYLDSFGEYRFESTQCFFKADPTGAAPFMIDKISTNRREVDPKIVTQFNRSLSVILTHMPDLDYPAPLADSLEDLQIDTDSLRKPIVDKSY
jgi:hypothetical protein